MLRTRPRAPARSCNSNWEAINAIRLTGVDKMDRNKLPDSAKAFIVTSLACFDAPSVVAARLKEEYGLKVARQAIEKYDPEKRAGRRLSPRWRDVHAKARERFRAEINNIAISNKAVRLRALQRLATRAEEAGNIQLAAQLLEQAAKEMGGAFNKHPEPSPPQKVRELSDFYNEVSAKQAADMYEKMLAETNSGRSR
jgi:hypothetical protein